MPLVVKLMLVTTRSGRSASLTTSVSEPEVNPAAEAVKVTVWFPSVTPSAALAMGKRGRERADRNV